MALASAASDVLGPEQLESVLALEPPADVEMVPGPASALAQHLGQVFAPVSAPRRLELLLDLWAQATSYQAEIARRARLLATQSRKSRTEDLRKRRKHHDDELILGLLRNWIADPEERLADVARWTPPDYYWRRRLDGIIQDAFAAIALLRTAVTVGEYGLNDACRRTLVAGTVMITCRAPEIDLMAVVSPRTVNVPGYPATTLDDETGPWQRAFPAAGELGADTSVFWDEIANHGLRVPSSWLTHGGWIPLWTRAHR